MKNDSQVRPLAITLFPVEGEELLSYLERLAAWHRVSPLILLHSIGIIDSPKISAWPRGLSIAAKNGFLTRLAVGMRLEIPEIKNMLLQRYQNTCLDFSKLDLDNNKSFPRVMTINWAFFHRLKFCPKCLEESGGAWKLEWRLPWIYACLKHKCFLALCPTCSTRWETSRPRFQRHSSHLGAIPKLGFCTQPLINGRNRKTGGERCSTDLRQLPIDGLEIPDQMLYLQVWIKRIVDGEDYPRLFGKQLERQEYFTTLRWLCKIFLHVGIPDDFPVLNQLPKVFRNLIEALVTPTDRGAIFARLLHAEYNWSLYNGLNHSPPLKPIVMAALLLCADWILKSPDLATVADKTRSLLETAKRRRINVRDLQTRYGGASLTEKIINTFVTTETEFDVRLPSLPIAVNEFTYDFTFDNIPQLLWIEDYDKHFRRLFPNIEMRVGQRICSTGLVKLITKCSWLDAEKLLGIPVYRHNLESKKVLAILQTINNLDTFIKALRQVAERISSSSQKINYGYRRNKLSTLSYIPEEHWLYFYNKYHLSKRYETANYKAALWIWSDLTGGDWRWSPSCTHHIYKAKTISSFFDLVLSIPLKNELRDYGLRLLDL